MKRTFPALSVHVTFQKVPGPRFSSRRLMLSQPLEHFSSLTGTRSALTRRWKRSSVCRNSPHSDAPDPGSASAAPDPLNQDQTDILLRITVRDTNLAKSSVKLTKMCCHNIRLLWSYNRFVPISHLIYAALGRGRTLKSILWKKKKKKEQTQWEQTVPKSFNLDHVLLDIM